MAVLSLARRWMASTRGGLHGHGGDADGLAINRSLELFADLTRRQVEQVNGLFTALEVGEGRVLGRQGQYWRDFVVVLDGEVAVLRDDAPLAVLTAGCHFGSLPLLSPRHDPFLRASFHTLGPGRIAVANRREFITLVHVLPLVGERIKVMADRRQAYLDGLDDGRRQAIGADAVYPTHLAQLAPVAA